MSTTTTTTKTLKNLIPTLEDGREGYRQAVEIIQDGRLKELFEMLATQRAQFARELETFLPGDEQDEPDDKGGTASGAVHRGWIDLKAALTKQDTHAILAEVERGEDVAKKAYSDALDENDLSPEVRSVVAKQAAEVLTAHNQVRDLRDATKKS